MELVDISGLKPGEFNNSCRFESCLGHFELCSRGSGPPFNRIWREGIIVTSKFLEEFICQKPPL